VPVVLAAALATSAPIVALHLTRPPVTIPDRAALGMDSHFEAARGAYRIRDYDKTKPKHGTVYVQGTSTTSNLIRVLPEIVKAGLNVKIVAAISPQLFRLQDAAYRERIAPTGDRWDAMVISNRGRRLATDWIANPVVAEYSLTSDWDDRWRTGGSVDEVVDEAHLSPKHILDGIERFVREREKRLGALRSAVEAAERH
jgi:transketolase